MNLERGEMRITGVVFGKFRRLDDYKLINQVSASPRDESFMAGRYRRGAASEGAPSADACLDCAPTNKT
ncbi:hypothetical protein EVAR_66974_1 [Eumeta japonica]|uniref:Uncharacterized protein n=1 Tax=Eumeta variegata TaxID=151549 RepID=A0A4C2A1R9_EUMVA|nr:hypothetical protein EVAR_66974_1 [Eumeta japonica]